MNTYKEMEKAVAVYGMPKYYKEDFTVRDKADLKEIKSGFLWMIRESGTYLFKLERKPNQYDSIESIADFYEYQQEKKAQWFKGVQGGTIEPISYQDVKIIIKEARAKAIEQAEKEYKAAYIDWCNGAIKEMPIKQNYGIE